MGTILFSTYPVGILPRPDFLLHTFCSRTSISSSSSAKSWSSLKLQHMRSITEQPSATNASSSLLSEVALRYSRIVGGVEQYFEHTSVAIKNDSSSSDRS